MATAPICQYVNSMTDNPHVHFHTWVIYVLRRKEGLSLSFSILIYIIQWTELILYSMIHISMNVQMSFVSFILNG